jgi:hypothetical protein
LSHMFDLHALDPTALALTLYTDAYVIRGTIMTRRHRITDVLNESEMDFIVISDVVMEEFGSRGETIKADYAQVNLDAVLFAVAEERIEPHPEMQTRKTPETALVSVPPFRVTGRIHLLPERDLVSALGELTGRFVPVTDASYWSNVVDSPRASAAMVAVNHSRAHILAPYQVTDPWAGLTRPTRESDDAAGGDELGADVQPGGHGDRSA